MKKGDQLLLIVSLTASLLLGEVACRLFLPRPGFVPLGSDDIPGLWTQHPVRGYVYTANFEGAMARDDFAITINTNEAGLRSGKGTQPVSTTQPIILAVGDSFTFGWGVEWEDAWPAQLEKKLRSSFSPTMAPVVSNVGVSGYNLRQIRESAMDGVEQYKPEAVIACVYPGAADRLSNPFNLLNGGLVRRNSVDHIKSTEGGYYFSPMYQPWVRAVDFWLDDWSALGASTWKQGYRLESGCPPPRSYTVNHRLPRKVRKMIRSCVFCFSNWMLSACRYGSATCA